METMKGYIVSNETFNAETMEAVGTGTDIRFASLEEARAEFERQSANIKQQYRVDFENNIGFEKKYIGITLNECIWEDEEAFEYGDYPIECEDIDTVDYCYEQFDADRDELANWRECND